MVQFSGSTILVVGAEDEELGGFQIELLRRLLTDARPRPSASWHSCLARTFRAAATCLPPGGEPDSAAADCPRYLRSGTMAARKT